MTKIKTVAYTILAALVGFLSLTALAGGIGILAGFGVPVVDLDQTIFTDLTVPGITLLGVVGGSALLSVILLVRRSRYAMLFAAVSGLIIMTFEFVEVQVIGAPAGIAQNLQIFYFGLGMLITMITLAIWAIDLRAPDLARGRPVTRP